MRIAAGTIIVKPNIASFTETDVKFTDGSVVKNVDAVVCSTGYEIGFPIVEEGNFIKVNKNHVDLYKFMFPLNQKHHTLAVLGLVQVRSSPTSQYLPLFSPSVRSCLSPRCKPVSSLPP